MYIPNFKFLVQFDVVIEKEQSIFKVKKEKNHQYLPS